MRLDKKILLEALLGLILLVVCFFSLTQYITDLPPNEDGTDNLGLAVGLAHTGSMGKLNEVDGRSVFVFSNSREPVPNLITAQWIKLFPVLMQDKTLHVKQTSQQLKLLKWPNLFMFMLTLVGVYVLARSLFLPYFSDVKAVLLVWLTVGLTYCCMHPVFISSLMTEFHAACLAVWFTWAWLVSWRKQAWRYGLLAGLLLGLLVLTKAAFLYISLVLLLMVLLMLLLWRMPWRFLATQAIVLAMMLVVVVPWMWRNYTHFDAWEVAGRGPNVLITRAYKSQMSHEEFKGAFYAYAPASLKKLMKSVTGFSATDREKGGRLQRFTRFFGTDEVCRAKGDEACAIGYYIRANIRYNNMMADYAKRYPHDPARARVEGDAAVKKLALQMIKQNIAGHLKTSLVFAWRGAWPCNKVDGRWFKHEKAYLQPAWQELVPFFGLCLMLVFAVIALFKKQQDWLVLTWLGTASFGFYALASHFIPRYSEMFLPIWLICLVFASSLLVRWLATPKHISI